MSALFLSFEGLEGSGKSTQVGMLASRLKEHGYDIVVTREPGGTRVGELIRAITHDQENVDLTSTAEAYLMAASRAQHVREIIRPALDSGKIVLADRYLDSSIAYQGYGRQLGPDVIDTLNHLAVDTVFPHRTLFLDVSPDMGVARRNGTKKVDRLDLQQKDFYERVYAGYKALARKHPKRFITIDGTAEIDKVAETIWRKVQEVI